MQNVLKGPGRRALEPPEALEDFADLADRDLSKYTVVTNTDVKVRRSVLQNLPARVCVWPCHAGLDDVSYSQREGLQTSLCLGSRRVSFGHPAWRYSICG